MIDYSKLAALAKYAMQMDHNENAGWYLWSDIINNGAVYPKNARFIEAARPDVVLALIAERDAWKENAEEVDLVLKFAAERDDLQAKLDTALMDVTCIPDMTEEITFLRAELSALKSQQPAAPPQFTSSNWPWKQEAPVAQPEPVNAMLVEALVAAEKLEHEALVTLSEATYELKVGNTYTTATDTYRAHNDLIHRLDKILNSQYRDRKRAAFTAAPVAQPAEAPDCRTCVHKTASFLDSGTDAMKCINCTNGDQYQEATKVVLWRTE
jgi:hypothetical protein